MLSGRDVEFDSGEYEDADKLSEMDDVTSGSEFHNSFILLIIQSSISPSFLLFTFDFWSTPSKMSLVEEFACPKDPRNHVVQDICPW